MDRVAHENGSQQVGVHIHTQETRIEERHENQIEQEGSHRQQHVPQSRIRVELNEAAYEDLLKL